MNEESYDVVIIGAGISGLTAAALLSKAGLSVIVLERHRLIGGYLQGFERNDFVFDTAIHWLNQCGENGTVTRIFKHIGDDFPRPQLMQKIQRHVGNEHDYTLTNNPDELRLQLIKDFPQDEKGINRFFSDARKIAEITKQYAKMMRSTETMGKLEAIKYNMRKASIGFSLVKHVFYSGEEGMQKGLSKYFKSPGIHQLFSAEQDLLSCLFPIAWAYLSDYQNPPIGGSQAFPRWLAGTLEKNPKVSVVLSADVQEVVISDGQFDKVVYTQRTKSYEVKGKYLIAACDAEVLYKKLLPPSAEGDKILAKIKDAEHYSSSVTISIALDCPAEDLGFGTELTLISNDESKRSEHSSGDPHKSAISVLAPTTRDHTLAPNGKGTLTIYVPAWMEYEDKWRTESDGKGGFKRTEAYKALKEEFALVIMDRVEQKLNIDLRKHIEFYEIATPITYHRYTKNRGGTMMGPRPGKKNMQSKVAKYKTPFKNVFLGGHWAELGGGVPIATKAAYNASLLVLKDANTQKYKELVQIMES